ncbi:MAG TPA: hypothetical protein VF982_11340 [Anaerolineales bacterium]
MVPSKTTPATLLILLLTAACTFPAQPTGEPAAAATFTATVSATPTSEPILPHPVYYLSRRSGSQQVWRLEADGVTRTQITTETADVVIFDVSRTDGSLAFVAQNQLYLVESDGGNRRLLVDNAAADPQAEGFYYSHRLSHPLFSPDGGFLAYSFDGVWILELASFQAVHFVENQLDITEDGTQTVERFYAPLSWAPNGQRLLLSLGGSESSTLGFLNPGAEPLLTEVENNSGLVCCQSAWAPDSNFLMVTSPYIGLVEQGAWRYDAATGARTALLDSVDDGLFHFAGWPLQTSDGSLFYFYASSAEVPDGDVPLFMVRSELDRLSQRTQLRPDAFSNIGEVLWAQDGSLALVVQVGADGGPAGSVLLAARDGRQLVLLLDEGHMLSWGP